MLVISIAYAWFCFSHSISIAASYQSVHFLSLLLPCMILSIPHLKTLVLLLPLTVRPDTAHINVAWQGTGMESLVSSTLLLLLPTCHTTQTTHLPHV